MKSQQEKSLFDSQPTPRSRADQEQINEANRIREKLESLGVWGHKGSKVRNPYYPSPSDPETPRQPIQNRSQL